MSGGFGLCGNAESCIEAIAASGVKNLTIISNNCGNQGQGLAVLLQNRQVARVICSFVGGNPDLAEQYLSGKVKVELVPQGTFAERIRAGGAGIAGFYTPTGVGTVVAEGKEVREIDGRKYLFERPLRADLAIVRAAVSDRFGNLRFYRTARNFNPLMATAAKVTVVEADRVVPTGVIDPDDVHLPGLYVKRIVEVPEHRDVIEHRTTARAARGRSSPTRPARARGARERDRDQEGPRVSWTREQMVRRAAAEVAPGQIVNLGIGMPTEVANYIDPAANVTLQSENGLLGMGPYPREDEIDARLINAGKETVTALPGASLFDSAQSFAMIRGGHIDLAILGGLEVACNGDLANWTVPGRLITGMGGAMDLAAGARRLVVLQNHASKDGATKLVNRLTLPATALACVNRVITDLGIFDVGGDCFVCVARAEGVSRETDHRRHRRPRPLHHRHLRAIDQVDPDRVGRSRALPGGVHRGGPEPC